MAMIKFEKSNRTITMADLLTFEEKYGYKLTEDYKTHMLKYNGGEPIGEEVFFGDDEYTLYKFFNLNEGDDSVATYIELSERVLPPNHLTIGRILGGNICICLKGANRGCVYAYYSECELIYLTVCFTDFVEGLEEG
ncbi:MAG: SMI1/KNR4 family protein [Saprospiraceae bacterium]